MFFGHGFVVIMFVGCGFEFPCSLDCGFGFSCCFKCLLVLLLEVVLMFICYFVPDVVCLMLGLIDEVGGIGYLFAVC